MWTRWVMHMCITRTHLKHCFSPSLPVYWSLFFFLSFPLRARDQLADVIKAATKWVSCLWSLHVSDFLTSATQKCSSVCNYMCCVFFRDSPVVQGNSILALSGLAAVLAKYESNLPADSDGSLGVRCFWSLGDSLYNRSVNVIQVEIISVYMNSIQKH